MRRITRAAEPRDGNGISAATGGHTHIKPIS